jgi:hypothetical protein
MSSLCFFVFLDYFSKYYLVRVLAVSQGDNRNAKSKQKQFSHVYLTSTQHNQFFTYSLAFPLSLRQNDSQYSREVPRQARGY